jgi:hypothetical protein
MRFALLTRQQALLEAREPADTPPQGRSIGRIPLLPSAAPAPSFLQETACLVVLRPTRRHGRPAARRASEHRSLMALAGPRRSARGRLPRTSLTRYSRPPCMARSEPHVYAQALRQHADAPVVGGTNGVTCTSKCRLTSIDHTKPRESCSRRSRPSAIFDQVAANEAIPGQTDRAWTAGGAGSNPRPATSRA